MAQKVKVWQDLKHICAKPGVRAQVKGLFCGMDALCCVFSLRLETQLNISTVRFPALHPLLIPCLEIFPTG